MNLAFSLVTSKIVASLPITEKVMGFKRLVDVLTERSALNLGRLLLFENQKLIITDHIQDFTTEASLSAAAMRLFQLCFFRID